MALMKQARGFGVGVVVATQNPMDLDYRALSNAGLWFLGRLQTDADRARVLDGLAAARGTSAGAGAQEEVEEHPATTRPTLVRSAQRPRAMSAHLSATAPRHLADARPNDANGNTSSARGAGRRRSAARREWRPGVTPDR